MEKVSSSAANLLIVDDEEMLVELLRRIVVRLGYHAISALSVKEALEIYEAQKESIDLIITDLVMPDIGGKALALELLQKYPNVRILISTGFSAMDEIHELLELGVRGVVMKPYQADQLNSSIQAALSD
jgi:two-component system cell cycle sensor histidine kinase/response regulator CckA